MERTGVGRGKGGVFGLTGAGDLTLRRQLCGVHAVAVLTAGVCSFGEFIHHHALEDVGLVV